MSKADDWLEQQGYEQGVVTAGWEVPLSVKQCRQYGNMRAQEALDALLRGKDDPSTIPDLSLDLQRPPTDEEQKLMAEVSRLSCEQSKIVLDEATRRAKVELLEEWRATDVEEFLNGGKCECGKTHPTMDGPDELLFASDCEDCIAKALAMAHEQGVQKERERLFQLYLLDSQEFRRRVEREVSKR